MRTKQVQNPKGHTLNPTVPCSASEESCGRMLTPKLTPTGFSFGLVQLHPCSFLQVILTSHLSELPGSPLYLWIHTQFHALLHSGSYYMVSKPFNGFLLLNIFLFLVLWIELGDFSLGYTPAIGFKKFWDSVSLNDYIAQTHACYFLFSCFRLLEYWECRVSIFCL